MPMHIYTYTKAGPQRTGFLYLQKKIYEYIRVHTRTQKYTYTLTHTYTHTHTHMHTLTHTHTGAWLEIRKAAFKIRMRRVLNRCVAVYVAACFAVCTSVFCCSVLHGVAVCRKPLLESRCEVC